MARTADAITRSHVARRGPTLEGLFEQLFGTIPEGHLVDQDYVQSLAQHGRDFFDSLSYLADPEGKSAGERLEAYWCMDPAANPFSPVVAFFNEVIIRIQSYGLPHFLTRDQLVALFADVRRAVESGEAVDGGAWVGVVGRKGLVRRGVARARDWKIRGEG